jgi:hypothetical protein
MIRAGVFGSGDILENALEALRQHSGFLITGYHSGGTVIQKHSVIKQFTLPEELISVSEALIITNNPGDFHEIIPTILKNSRHLLIYPDYSLSFFQLEIMLKLAEEAGVVLYLHQDGIKDWMKDLVQEYCGKPEFIEVYSYIDKHHIIPGVGIFGSLYKAISAVMKLNPVNPRKFYTNMVPYCSPDPLMTNVRLEFENGTSANITINGFFERSDSKIEVFRNDCEAIIDPFAPEIKIISKNPNSTRSFNKSPGIESNLFQEGLDGFALRLNSPTLNNDPFESGIIAHKTATNIIHQFIPYPLRSLE